MFPKASYPLTPEQLFEAARNRCDPLVAFVNDVIAGYGNFIEVDRGSHCSIGNLIIEPSHRGKGVASYLIGTFVDMAFQRYAANYVRISCFNLNIAGLLLYYKMGFRPVDLEERKGPGSQRVALIHMHLNREERV
ncbi:GNAT family N-acetyltransferase [Prosthecochloris sp.]|uniref:GNAT family N-acetyltransferase n=1 Tax=Prosthecochloris sp. TaxID=290513 RepID=UPI0025D0E991|nr:GNAT family N-acetyltransferase [Prosthecochloris sp.]